MKRQMISLVSFIIMLVLLTGTNVSSIGAAGAPSFQGQGHLAFLGPQDNSFALVANSSYTFEEGKQYPDEILLVTGLPDHPQISARVSLPMFVYDIVLSPDGDTALVSSSSFVFPSRLALLRHVKAFVQSHDPKDLNVTIYRAEDVPQVASIEGMAFGPDGSWAVLGSYGPDGLVPDKENGVLVVMSGLPDNPTFSNPIPLPILGPENLDLSLDGDTLLVTDAQNFASGVEKSQVVIVKGIAPGGAPPTVVGPLEIPAPKDHVPFVFVPGVEELGPPMVDDSKLTPDGKFIIAPNPLFLRFDDDGVPVGVNTITIIGGVQEGKLKIVRVLTEKDGVGQGPLHVVVSPDGDTALVVDILDSGATRLTGLASGDPARFRVEPLPFPFFGIPFPLGPDGPPALSNHSDVRFTADGDSAVVADTFGPGAPPGIVASVVVLTGFRSGNIRVASQVTDPMLNPSVLANEEIATVPSGLIDRVNTFLPPGNLLRLILTNLVNQAIAAERRGQPDVAAGYLNGFVRSVTDAGRQGIVLTSSQAASLATLASVGIKTMQQ